MELQEKIAFASISWGPDVRRCESDWRSGRGFQLTKSLQEHSDVSSISSLTHQELYQTVHRSSGQTDWEAIAILSARSFSVGRIT